MHKTSRIAPQAVLKLFLKHARHPWIARRLAALPGIGRCVACQELADRAA